MVTVRRNRIRLGRVQRRHLCVTVLALIPLLPMTIGTDEPSSALASNRHDYLLGTNGSAGISALPLPAQATISQTLGRDNRAYHAAGVNGGFRVENERHDLRARFSATGVEVSSENEGLTLSLRAYGYGDALRPVAGAQPQVEANRVVYRRGPLEEWYVNGPLGLEQGFTLDAPPAGPRESPLTLSMTVGGTLDAQLDAEGDGLTFASSSVRYQGLFAMDADGRDVPAWLELDGRTLALRVDDAGARYPLTIDPFFQQAQLTASDGASNDRFGTAAAVSGDTALVGAAFADVGANADQGSAYVFTRTNGIWTQQAKLTASDGAAGDLLGISVALSGETALVGAQGHDVGGNVDQGAAYVFTRTGNVWTEQAQLTASDGAAGDQFGRDGGVALDGDTALVGARNDDVAGRVDQGSAYVFTRAGADWTQQAQLTASDGAARDEFGVSVAINGDTALVGARSDDVAGRVDQGSAYVFTRAVASWNLEAHLTASDGAARDWFGDSVALNGDTVLVGSPINTVNGNVRQGSAYVFTRTGTAWTEQAQLIAADGAADDRLTQDGGVAISGDTALVGAWGDDVGANADQGSAYLFTRAAGVWTQTAKLTAGDGAAGDEFGDNVALSGDTVLVASYKDDVGANLNQGSAYVFAALPTQQDQCKNGGWKTFGIFKNQGDCVSFVATKGKNQPSGRP